MIRQIMGCKNCHDHLMENIYSLSCTVKDTVALMSTLIMACDSKYALMDSIKSL